MRKIQLIMFAGLLVSAIAGAEELTVIKMGKGEAYGFGDKRVKIELLSPLVETGCNTGGTYLEEEDKDISIMRLTAGDHGFLYTSEGDLFIDNFYVGNHDEKDRIQFGHHKVWVNGSQAALSIPSERQSKIRGCTS